MHAKSPWEAGFNPLALEADIIDHLTAKIPALVRVDSAAALDAVKLAQMPSPSAAVVFMGERGSANVQGEAKQWTQYWGVVLVAKFSNDKTGANLRDIVGPLIPQMKRAIASLPVPEGYDPVQLDDEVTPDIVGGSAMLTPFIFTTSYLSN